MKKFFKKIGKADFGGILVDRKANCFCRECYGVLVIKPKNETYQKGVYRLYEIMPQRRPQESEWQFVCTVCERIFTVPPHIQIKLIDIQEAQDRIDLEIAIEDLFSTFKKKFRIRYSIKYRSP